MIRRKKFLGIAIAAVLGLLLALWAVARWQQPEDPIYAGTPLSVHLFTLYGSSASSRIKAAPNQAAIMTVWQAEAQKRSAARNALQSVQPGREVLPLITNWLATPPMSWKLKLGNFLRRYNADHLNLSADRRLIAWRFLAEYPVGSANELLPFFAQAISSTNLSDLHLMTMAVSRALGNATNVNIDALLRVLMPLKYNLQSAGTQPPHNSPFPVFFSPSYSIDHAIERVDPNRMFRPLYILELGPTPERVGAAMELAEFPRMPERAVPLLTANLTSTNRSVQEQCAVALGKFGDKASNALPALDKLLAHPRERVRFAASNAIVEIQRKQSAEASPKKHS